MNTNKKFYDYFLCLSKISHGDLSREEAFFCFDSISTKLLVALELHCDINKIHFHVYLRTNNNVFFLINVFYNFN